MSRHRQARGVPWPRLSQVLVVVAAVARGWLWGAAFQSSGPDQEPRPPHGDPIDRMRSLEGLVQEGGDALPQLIPMLSSDDPVKRRDALYGLGRLGPEAAAALDAIRERLSDDDPRVRDYALTALARITAREEEAIAAATTLLADRDAGVRQSAERLLLHGS